MEVEKQLLPMIFITLVLALILPTVFIIPSAPNPINDFTSTLGINVAGTGGPPQAGTTNGPSADSIRQAQAQNAGCAGSVLAGAAGGAIIGTIVPGIGTLIGAVGGAIVGAVAGCAVLPAVAPGVVQSFGNSIINGANSIPGGLGDFMRAILTLLNFVGALIKFIPDYIVFQIALLEAIPAIALFLVPVEAYDGILLGLYVARVGRGSEG
jgi:hypothetical protein